MQTSRVFCRIHFEISLVIVFLLCLFFIAPIEEFCCSQQTSNSCSGSGTFGVSDYPELGTRFKAAHVKTMCWWVGYKLEELSRESESYMHSLHSSFFRYL